MKQRIEQREEGPSAFEEDQDPLLLLAETFVELKRNITDFLEGEITIIRAKLAVVLAWVLIGLLSLVIAVSFFFSLALSSLEGLTALLDYYTDWAPGAAQLLVGCVPLVLFACVAAVYVSRMNKALQLALQKRLS